jgi:hypothetical protein
LAVALLLEYASTSLQRLPFADAKKLCFADNLGRWWVGAVFSSS